MRSPLLLGDARIEDDGDVIPVPRPAVSSAVKASDGAPRAIELRPDLPFADPIVATLPLTGGRGSW